MTKSMPLNVRIRGAKSPSGLVYYGFKQHHVEVFVPGPVVASDPSGLMYSLADQGLCVGGRATAAQLLETASAIDRYDTVDILPQAGWYGSIFARVDGEFHVPESVENVPVPPGIGYRRHADRYRHEGELAGWQNDALPALLQDDAATLIMAMALAPTLRPVMLQAMPPFGIEIVTSDVAIYRAITHSVIGSMNANFLAADPVERVLAEPLRHIEASQDSLLLVGDVQNYLVGAADKKRPAAVRRLLFDQLLANDGSETNAAGVGAPMFMLINRRPIADLLGLESRSRDRLREGLLSINVGSFGCDHQRVATPELASHKGGRSNATYAFASNFGVALHEFQRQLVRRRGKQGLGAVQVEVARDVAFFQRRARNVFELEHLPDYVTQPFALLYATIRMAVRLGVLPKIGGKPPAVWRAFERFVAERPKTPTAASILMAVATRPDVRVFHEIDPNADQAELERVPAFIKLLKSGSRELWVMPGHKEVLFEWRRFSQLADFDAWYIPNPEVRHDGWKRALGQWKNARVVRFKLPNLSQ